MIDRSFIGYQLPPFTATLEKGQMELFARALGERGSIFSDEDVARAAGYPGLVAFPTYLIRLGTRDDLTYGLFRTLGIDLARLLNGEQEFRFGRPACAGETLHGTKRVKDIFDRKGGALEFVVTETSYHDGGGAFVGADICTFVVRNG